MDVEGSKEQCREKQAVGRLYLLRIIRGFIDFAAAKCWTDAAVAESIRLLSILNRLSRPPACMQILLK